MSSAGARWGRCVVFRKEEGDAPPWMMAPASVAPSSSSAPAAAQAPEIQFAQRLAANDKRIRDRALKKLRGYITLRTQNPAGSFSEEELLKIWKGLFYCMWMQDKPLLQEALSSNISQLVHVIENMDARHLFIQTFWQTMNREWTGIDRLRLDKFYTLMRMMLNQSFEVLKRNGWNESFTEPFLNMLMKVVMHPDSNTPVGVKLHFIDIYLEELAKVGAKELTADQNLKLIEPLSKIVAKTKDHLELQAIIHGIFETILDQSPFAIEDIMKEIGADSDDDLSEEDECSDEDNALSGKERSLQKAHSLRTERQDKSSEATDDNIGPVLQFDYKTIADMLFELASRKNTPPFNRKCLYKVIKKFQDLAEGNFPQDDFPEDVSTDEDDDTFSRKNWKRKSGKPLDPSKMGGKENTQNRKNSIEEEDDSTEPQKKRKKRKRKASQMADSCKTAGSNESGPNNLEEPKQDNGLPNSKKKRNKFSRLEAGETGSSAAPIGELTDNSTPTCLVNNVKKESKKKNGSPQKVCIETVHQNGQAISTEETSGNCTTVVNDSKMIKKKWKSQPRITPGNGYSEVHVKRPENDILTESEPTMLQKVKLKKNQKLGDLVKIRSFKPKIIGLKKQRKVRGVLNSTQENEVEGENKKGKNKKDGGPAVLQKKKNSKAENEFVKFEKTALPKPAFFRKAKGNLTSVKLNKLQFSGSKKVTFGLNKNMTAEFKKTDKSILVSPEGPSRVAFNPKQKPPHGVLKSPAESPQMKKPLWGTKKKRPTAVDFF
ncbi:ribosomal RNA processing protein 1 homolog B isoform X1 [Anolis carolinensis]|uniref:Ribosomal RNA processing 1B n=1 Tax=Anolis carolinensis TaxID=28377 RepID=G1KUF1_ANOCA|nr:PREDICTED: ribosomal RNA processing protein 1 homolog B isoform X1 [Anolis carolinensis]|eukprot:XP_008105663.1 PREDICTED: ribosomal RNA processing protein 1 homolog B isoform X1 [Anolis carolinensis]